MGSKLGPHCIVPTTSARQMLEAGAWGGLLLDDFGLATQFPNAKWIGRVYSPFTAESQSGNSPSQAASDFVDTQISKYALNLAIKIWQGHNEPVWANAAEMAWYTQFEIERMKIMQNLNLKCVIGNFSVGNPDLSLWPAFLSALRFARDNGHYLALHEYSAPWMWWMTGRYQVDPLADEGDEGWTTLRYRKIYRQFLQPEGIGNLPLVITECGLDQVSPGPEGWMTGNWRTCAEQWSAKEGREDGERYYADQLVWYDRELQKDPYVVGACIFTFGQNNDAWRDYDVAGTRVVDYLVEHIQSGGGELPPPPREIAMNLSFENGWTDVGPEQQQPNDWILRQTPPGQIMGIPTKHSGGISPDAGFVPAVAEAKGEVVHKLNSQLPPGEQRGQRRALILDGDATLKSFWGLANETVLTTTVVGTPGSAVRIKVPVLGESNLVPQPPNTKLEDDNWWVTVYFGETINRRNYLEMTSVKEVAGNERNWNVFTKIAVFPAEGKLLLSITLQDNWGGTDWFIDNITLEEVTYPPPPPIGNDVLIQLKLARDQAQVLASLLNEVYTEAAVDFVDRSVVLKEAQEVVDLLKLDTEG